MELMVNGSKTEYRKGATLADLLNTLGIDERVSGVAVALNSAVITRTLWAETVLSNGDTIEVIQAVQGG